MNFRMYLPAGGAEMEGEEYRKPELCDFAWRIYGNPKIKLVLLKCVVNLQIPNFFYWNIFLTSDEFLIKSNYNVTLT